MSTFLWGLGELTNDPSSTLISSLRKHLFRKSTEHDSIITPETISKQVSKNSFIGNDQSPVSTQGATCSKKSESKSKRVQVGSTPPRQLSTQCSAILHETSDKSTSIPNVPYYDRSCTTAVVKTKDASTKTDSVNICEDHKQVFSTLRNWKSSKTKETTQNKIIVLIDKLVEILKLFKLEKIQSVPRYQGTDMEIIKLYKSVSLDKVSNLSEVKQKRGKLF